MDTRMTEPNDDERKRAGYWWEAHGAIGDPGERNGYAHGLAANRIMLLRKCAELADALAERDALREALAIPCEDSDKCHVCGATDGQDHGGGCPFEGERMKVTP